MRKLFNYGLIAIFGAMTILAPSCTKDIKDDIDEIRTQIETLTMPSMLDAEIKAIETQLATLETSINTEIKATKEKITAIESQISSLATKADLSALAARIIALETWKTTVVTDLTDIKAELVKVREEYKAGDDAVIAKLAETETKLTAEILRIDGQINGMLGDIATMKNDIAENAADITKNAEAVAKNAETIAKNGTAIEKNAADIAANTLRIVENYQAYLSKVIEIETSIGNLLAKDELIDEAIKNAAEEAKNEYIKIREEIATQKFELETLINEVKDELILVQERMTTAENDIQNLKDAGIELGNRITSEIAQEVINRNSAITTAVKTETEARKEAINSINTQLTTIESNISTIRGDITTINSNLEDINADITAIKGRIQAINFISDYTDGKATVYSIDDKVYSDMTLRFRVYPAEQAAELVKFYPNHKENFILNLNSVKTKAVVGTTLNILKIDKGIEAGDIIVTARPNSFKISDTESYSLSLDVKTALNNTSSNVIAIDRRTKFENNIQYTSKNTQVGNNINNGFDIGYNNTLITVEIDNDFKLGAFSSGWQYNFQGFISDFGFNYTTKITKIELEYGTFGYIKLDINDLNSENKAEKAAAEKGFNLSVENKTVQIAADRDKIGNTLTLTVEATMNNVKISTSTIKVNIIRN